jgi:hypothetical protein
VKEHRVFLVVLALIVAGRLWFVFSFPVVQRSDYQAYYDEARSFAGLRAPEYTSLNATGPKLLYSIPFRLFGADYTVLGVTNTVLYAAGMLFAYLGALRLFGRSPATLTAAIGLSSLSEIYFTNLACTEVPGTFFMSLILWLMARGDGSLRSAVLLGVASGIAIYNRPNLLPIGGLVFLHRAMVARALREPLRTAAVVQVVALALTLPLCFLNLRHFGRFTPFNSNKFALWTGNNPTMRGDFHNTPDMPENHPPGSALRRQLTDLYRPFYVNPDPEMQFARMGAYEVDDVITRYAVAYIRQEPRLFLQRMVARFQLLFFSCTYGEAPYTLYDPAEPGQPRWRPAHRRLLANARLPVRRWYQVLIAGAALGVVATIWRARRSFLGQQALPLLVVLYYSFPFLLTMGANRYHVPILNLAWMYLANGLVVLGGLGRPEREDAAATGRA